MLLPVPKRALVALPVLFLTLLSACGGGGSEGGVNVKTVATDLTFGIPGTPKPAPPANTNPIPSDPLGTVVQGEDPSSTPRPPLRPPADPCPKAPPDAFPPVQPSEIAGVPKEGTYRWRYKGTQTVPAVGKIPLAPQSLREVVAVGTVNGGPKFTVEEKEVTFGSQFTVRTTYEFRVATADLPGAGGPAKPVDDVVAGASNVEDTGLYLTKIERIHRQNAQSNSEFNPSPPILILPTPVTLGSSVTSAGVDPVTFEVFRQDGSITKRQRIDACGKPQDSFYAETTREFVSADGATTRAKFNYGISTVMGGLPVLEQTESPCVDASGECAQDAVTFKLDAHIGQLEPDD